jgi:putative endopeptidase
MHLCRSSSLPAFALLAASLLTFSPALSAQSVAPNSTPNSAAKPSAAPDLTYKLIPGLDRTLMDPSLNPCDDFYQYACGNWGKLHPIAPDSPYSGQFYNLDQFNQQVLHAILEKSAAAPTPPASNTQKIGDYYASCMDEAAINAKGLAPLQPELDRIAALKSKADLTPLLAHYQLTGVNAFFGFGKQQDFRDATHNVAYVAQGGTDLERDYFFRTGAKDVEIRQHFQDHIANTLKLLGEPEAQAKADAAAILKLQTALAKISLDVTTLRDPQQTYHWLPATDLARSTPSIHWDEFFRATNSPAFTSLNIAEPTFFTGLETVLQQTDLPTIQAYLRWELINSSSALTLPKALDEEHFNFEDSYLVGIPVQELRWKRCTRAVDGAIGEALGQAYVEQQFPASSKAATTQMLENIEAAMGDDLKSIDWMSPATKKEALLKLSLVTNKVGYPSMWRDYSKLDVVRGDAYGNRTRAVAFENRRQLAQIGQPVDRNEWGSSPPTVNAWYSPSMNDITFPAGVLQPAFYDPSQPDAINYGHIGLFMGHEMTHGFDDQGRQFDGNGNLRDWWTKEDADKFTQKAACIVDEYGSFRATPDTKLNGKLTLGENTADNGGLRLAYTAYLALAARQHIDLTARDEYGYTPVQQFFVGFAQDWCSSWRPELERLIATTDPHSPDRFRTNGVLVNFPEFATAFGCKAGSKMAPVKSCRVW